MIDHGLFISRLFANCASFGGRVYDIALFARDAGGWPTLPVAYVYPVSDMPGSDYRSSIPRQSVTATIAVLLVSRSASGAFSSLAALRNEVADALLGWTPPGCYETPQYAGGTTEEIIDADILVEDRYSVRYLLSNF